MIFFCNTAWLHCQLGPGESWPENGSLNYIILQLDLFCKISVSRSPTCLDHNKNLQKTCKIMVQREDLHRKPVFPESNLDEDISLSHLLAPTVPLPSSRVQLKITREDIMKFLRPLVQLRTLLYLLVK